MRHRLRNVWNVIDLPRGIQPNFKLEFPLWYIPCSINKSKMLCVGNLEQISVRDISRLSKSHSMLRIFCWILKISLAVVILKFPKNHAISYSNIIKFQLLQSTLPMILPAPAPRSKDDDATFCSLASFFNSYKWNNKYLLLIEGRTVRNRPRFFQFNSIRFFQFNLRPSCSALGPWIEVEKQGAETYGTDRQNEVSNMFISWKLNRAGK